MKSKIVFVIAVFVFLSFFGNLMGTVKAADADIAQEYAPIFYFEKDEACFPVDVSYHISNSYLYQIDVVNPIHQSPTAEIISNYNDNSYYLDNQKGTIEDDGIINGYKSKNLGYTVYSHVFDSGGLTYVQYWMFYAFNKGTMNQHEGDWEMVQVILSGGAPSQVMYSQHHGGQTATWNQVEKEGSHIKVYVSRGSHANYLRSYSGVVGIANDIVGANGKKLTLSEYDIVILESQAWLDFGGLWGWSGTTEEESGAALLLGQTGPNGPKYRENGVMWNASNWEDYLNSADNNIFILELFLYNFVTIFIILAIMIIGILLYRIYKLKKTTGLGPRIISIFYIDGLNAKSIGNILCIVGIIIAIFSLFNPWYLISTDIGISGYETDGMTDMMTIDGINGIQIQVPGLTGPIPMGSIMVPFSLLIGIGLVFLFIASFGISHSKKLGRKYIFRGVRLIVPIIIIIIIIIALSMIPFESMVDTGDASINVDEVISEISGSPFGGQKIVTIPEVNGQVELQWGLGFGGILLLLSGLIMIIAGLVENYANVHFFSGIAITEPEKERKFNSKKKTENKEKIENIDKKDSVKMTAGICPSCGKKFESRKTVSEEGKIYATCSHCGKKLLQKKK